MSYDPSRSGGYNASIWGQQPLNINVNLGPVQATDIFDIRLVNLTGTKVLVPATEYWIVLVVDWPDLIANTDRINILDDRGLQAGHIGTTNFTESLTGLNFTIAAPTNVATNQSGTASITHQQTYQNVRVPLLPRWGLVTNGGTSVNVTVFTTQSRALFLEKL